MPFAIDGSILGERSLREATLAIVAKVPESLLRHAVAPHPTVNQVWDPLLAHESELATLHSDEEQAAQRSLR